MARPAIPLDAIPEPAFLFGPGGTVVAANPAGERLAGGPVAGLAADELAQRLGLRLLDGGSYACFSDTLNEALAGGSPAPMSGEITDADRSALAVLITAAPVPEEGRPSGALTIWHDSTLPGHLGGDLAESEAKYRNLVELSPDAILIHQDGAIVFANPAAAVLVGAPAPAELVGRAILEIVDPGGRGDVAWNIEADLRGEVSPLTVVDILRPDGTTVMVQGRGSRIPFAGRPAVQVVLRDITKEKRAEAALRESEERLRSVLEISLDTVYRRDLVADRYDYVSPVIEALTGHTVDEFAGIGIEGILERIHPDDRDAVRASIEEGAAALSGTVEYRIRHRDGNYRWVSDYFVVQTDADGRPILRGGVLRDITRRRRNEEALKRFAEELERSNEELQRFAYVASHDLQEPLRSIVSFSELLERRLADHADPDVREFLAYIIEGGVRMQTLIQDLLQLSRIETQARPPEPIDAGGVVDDVLSSLETSIREAGATVEVGPMPTVMADPGQLGQVFSNLVGNALKYRRPDVPLEVRISAEPEGSFWRFAVADNGIGIEPEYFDRIFVIFQRLHTRDAYPGTGIGLAVVQKIVERHGGTVCVESAPGEGSTFFFTIPAA